MIPTRSGARHLFPMTEVGPGESASGMVEFPEGAVTAEARVVFAGRGVAPAMAEVEMGR